MSKSYAALREKMSPAARARAQKKYEELVQELPLHELRTARRLSQEQVALQLGIKQAAVSKIERRTDLYLSTLRRFVEAMGGEFEVRAHFPDGCVQIVDLGELAASSENQPKRRVTQRHRSKPRTQPRPARRSERKLEPTTTKGVMQRRGQSARGSAREP